MDSPDYSAFDGQDITLSLGAKWFKLLAFAGPLPTPSLRNLSPSESQNFRINLESTGGTVTYQEAEGHVPDSVLQFLRTIFPGGQIEHVGDFNSQGIPINLVTEHSVTATGAMDAQQAVPEVTDEGIFLSNMLQDMMPFISQDMDPNVTPPKGSSTSKHKTDTSSQVSFLCNYPLTLL